MLSDKVLNKMRAYLLDGENRNKDLVLITFVDVSCRLRRIFELNENSNAVPGNGSKFSGKSVAERKSSKIKKI